MTVYCEFTNSNNFVVGLHPDMYFIDIYCTKESYNIWIYKLKEEHLYSNPSMGFLGRPVSQTIQTAAVYGYTGVHFKYNT